MIRAAVASTTLAARPALALPRLQGRSCSTASRPLSSPRASSVSISRADITHKGLVAHSTASRRSIAAAATGSGAMAGEQITLGGGCFWCLDACYRQLRGVIKSECGYAAGDIPNPTYKQVCGGDTGHAEVVQVTYDPSTVSLKELLEVFFVIHDPTQLNRQGNDVGTQYRSIILYHTPEQKAVAEEVMGSTKTGGFLGVFSAPIVTQLQPFDPKNYYAAEAYHQNYYEQNPSQGYCQFVVAGKVAKLRSKFMSKLIK